MNNLVHVLFHICESLWEIHRNGVVELEGKIMADNADFLPRSVPFLYHFQQLSRVWLFASLGTV